MLHYQCAAPHLHSVWVRKYDGNVNSSPRLLLTRSTAGQWLGVVYELLSSMLDSRMCGEGSCNAELQLEPSQPGFGVSFDG